MISNFKPYPTMKDSGVPWLGKVPEHWEMERGKWLFRKMDRPIHDTDEVVTCFRDGIVTLRKNRRIRGFTESLKEIGYQGIRRGDLVIHGMDAFAGAIGVADSDGKGTPVYSVCEPGPTANAQYYAYALREMARNQWIQALAKGIRERSTDFRFEGFGAQPVPLPLLPEQAAIVRFLDHADRRIRRYIRAKQKLIKLLEEQKQAVIHQAVTGQIDIRTGQPYPAYKDSGVEWLERAPEHWTVLPLKRAFVSMEYGISDTGTDVGTIAVLTMRHIRAGRVTVAKYGGVMSVAPDLLLQDKDLLFNRTNSADLVAKVGLFRSGEGPVTFASYLVRMRTREENNPEFLNFLLNDVGFLAAARREAIPSLHQSNLNPSRYGRLSIALPSSSEQHAILQSIEQTTSHIDAAVVRVDRQIERFREYRTRLIADVVTGKLDVREAAAGLPEVDPLADEFDALTTQATETGMMELEDATESSQELTMENEATV